MGGGIKHATSGTDNNTKNSWKRQLHNNRACNNRILIVATSGMAGTMEN
jgi:hypothetical protein